MTTRYPLVLNGTTIQEIQSGDTLQGLWAPKLFAKSNPYSALLTKASTFSVVTAQDFYAEVNYNNILITSGTSVTMPGTPVSGTDYALWVKPDGTLEVTNSHTTPPITSAVRLAGFHYAPGGNATGTSGGNSTPQINEYSIWDTKFRFAGPDPRGMVLVAGGFWSDIYLLNTEHIANGTSKYNATIADGSSPAKIPTQFGGTGSDSYGSLTWWEAEEIMRAYGKRLPTYGEFAALAYGTTEESSVGGDPGSASWQAAYVSKWGCNQVSGVMWQWGAEFGGPYAVAAWSAITCGRGSVYNQPNAAIFGGDWVDGSNCGSRASTWLNSPSDSSAYIGARGVGDHLILV